MISSSNSRLQRSPCHLPTELLSHILSFTYQLSPPSNFNSKSESIQFRKWFSSLALINHHWCGEIQRFLFSEIILSDHSPNSKKNLDQIQNRIETEELIGEEPKSSLKIGNWVQAIIIRPKARLECAKGKEFEQRIRIIVSRIKNLRRVLCMGSISESLLGYFSSIESIEYFESLGNSISSPRSPPPPSATGHSSDRNSDLSFPVALFKLKIFTHSSLNRFLSWKRFLTNSINSLTDLTITSPELKTLQSSQHLSEFIGMFELSLKRLNLELPSFHYSDFQLLTNLPNLVLLEIVGPPRTNASLLSILPNLCFSTKLCHLVVKHLSLIGMTTTTTTTTTMMKSPSLFPLLETLDLESSRGSQYDIHTLWALFGFSTTLTSKTPTLQNLTLDCHIFPSPGTLQAFLFPFSSSLLNLKITTRNIRGLMPQNCKQELLVKIPSTMLKLKSLSLDTLGRFSKMILDDHDTAWQFPSLQHLTVDNVFLDDIPSQAPDALNSNGPFPKLSLTHLNVLPGCIFFGSCQRNIVVSLLASSGLKTLTSLNLSGPADHNLLPRPPLYLSFYLQVLSSLAFFSIEKLSLENLYPSTPILLRVSRLSKLKSLRMVEDLTFNDEDYSLLPKRMVKLVLEARSRSVAVYLWKTHLERLTRLVINGGNLPPNLESIALIDPIYSRDWTRKLKLVDEESLERLKKTCEKVGITLSLTKESWLDKFYID